ncbi:NAD(P)H-binding protein [Zavarzinia aquatilis]|uniref:NAD(P)-binding domain-containing protein n=1 Tax=Zavarzinia aquatilis TaxID=2211142 RepID=A0A317DX43_9PROT|nr:NAD(P)H-binding protein [Zavarzinia aquatilis]PWR19317.1 hypothetical protein DKG74_17720 [Zavarzinia aquatilis]
MTGNGKTALILGITGGVGGATATALRRYGWTIRALLRDPAKLPTGLGIEARRGDALRPAEVIAAAEGVDAIVHGVNPPGYRHWETTVIPMLRSSIAAAKASGARIVLPGTVYNFGSHPPALAAEDAAQVANTKKGAIRIAMERALEDSGLPVLILRCGDFFGGPAGNSWFGQAMVRPGRPVTRIVWPGRDGVGHAFAYLPDVGETIARLLAREADLPRFARFHFDGHWFADGGELLAACRAATGRDALRLGRFPWPLVRLAAPVVPLFREMAELRYLWQVPLRLDNRRLTAFLGAEPHTPAPVALREALRTLGCLAAAPVAEKAPAR